MAVNTPTKRHTKLKEKRELVKTLYAGTQAMRDAGTKYLPREPNEKDAMYHARRDRSFLNNAVKSAVQGIRGKVFSKVVQVEDWHDVVPLKNVDLQGTDITTFASDLFTKGTLDGMAFILTDAPAMVGVESAADVEAQNIRPFWTIVEMDNFLGWKIETINNVPMLTECRILEEHIEMDDDFNEKEFEQVRHLKLVLMSFNENDEEDLQLGFITTIWRKEKGEAEDTWFSLPRS
jgi:hypothetical protein